MSEAAAAAKARIAEIAEQMAVLREERRRLARSVVAEVAGRLRAMKVELREIAESLSAAEGDEEAEDEAGQLRSAIECVIADSLEPAIENLEKAAQSRLPAGET